MSSESIFPPHPSVIPPTWLSFDIPVRMLSRTHRRRGVGRKRAAARRRAGREGRHQEDQQLLCAGHRGQAHPSSWRILLHLSHPNVVRIRDVLDPTNELNYSDLWVVFDFVDLDLRKLIASPQTITVQHVQWISHQVCAGNSVEPSQPAVRCLWKLPQAVHTARHGPSPRTVHGLARCRSRPIRSSGHSTTYTLLTCCTVT